jgi:DNA-nicking Smr family endonuclease
MDNDDSIYRALSDLADFIKDKGIQVRKPSAAPPEHRADEPFDFSDAMKDVKLIPGESKRIGRATSDRTLHLPVKDNLRRLLEEIVQKSEELNVTNLPEYMEGFTEGTSPLTMEKLRKGDFSVEKSLDLHGYDLEEAALLFEDFIKRAVKTGLHCVKVIHGRGLKSREGPVLKESLKNWIVRAMHRKWVTAFASCAMANGGPGATSILLRTRPAKKRIHIVG